MKATDLMCGDWVLIEDSPCKIQSLNRLNEYSASDRYAELYVGHTNYIKGITLTSEILEKNGFKFENDSEFQIRSERLLSDDTYIYIRFHKIETCHINLSHRGGMEDLELNIHISYVHQFQHVLRLYRLDELADNFKV